MSTVPFRDDFDANECAEKLRGAMKGLGTDEEPIIEILGRHPNAQRQEMKEAFKTLYGEELEDKLKSELRGDLEDVTLALMTTPSLYDARCLRGAMKGPGTDDSVLIEIMCGRTNDEIEAIKEAYAKEYDDRVLEDDLKSDSTGTFERLLVSQCNAARDESCDADWDQANEDAQKIIDAGEAQWGTDEAEINAILCSRSYAQLRATFKSYENITGKDIEEAIRSETSGNAKAGYIAIVEYAKSPVQFFAKRLYKTMKGAGTDDEGLIRILVTRSEVDLRRVKRAFLRKYEQSLYEWLEGEVGGDYKLMLMSVCGIDVPDEEEEDE